MSNFDHKMGDLLYRIFGLCYMEEKVKKSPEKDPKLTKSIDDLKGMFVREMVEIYKGAKESNSIEEGSILESVGRIMENIVNGKEDDIEKAKRLLESKGYDIIAKNQPES